MNEIQLSRSTKMEERPSSETTRARDPNRMPGGLFAPGNHASPGRPKNVGRTLKETMNDFQALAVEELQTIAENPKESVVRRTAAIRLLGTLASNRDGREETNLILEHTDGKPVQCMDISVGGQLDVSTVSLPSLLVHIAEMQARIESRLVELGATPALAVEGPIDISVEDAGDQGPGVV